MSCGHQFHLRCITQWLQKPDGTGNCPCCRGEPKEEERLVAAAVESDSEDEDEDEPVQITNQTLLMLAAAAEEDSEIEVKALLAGEDLTLNLEERDSDGDTALVYAIIYTNIAAAVAILDAGASLETRDQQGRTPLMRAIAEEQLEGARLLIDRGANLDVTDMDGISLLEYAAEIDDIEAAIPIIQNILETGVSCLGEALHVACHCDSLEVVELLLNAGADPNYLLESGRSPLVSASSIRIVSMLLARGGDPNIVDIHGLSVVMHHVLKGDMDPVVIGFLLKSMVHWERGSDGRWREVMRSWGESDAAQPPYELAEKTRVAARTIQARVRGWLTRRQLQAVSALYRLRTCVTYSFPAELLKLNERAILPNVICNKESRV